NSTNRSWALMLNSIRWRITVTYFSLFLLTILLLSGVLSKVLENYFINNLTVSLTKEAIIAQQFIEGSYPANQQGLDALVKELGATISTRITIIDHTGRVISDSDEIALIMDNHLDRPEFIQALDGKIGSSTRFSTTINTTMTYVALPLTHKNEVVGAVRLSIPTDQIHSTLREINTILLFTFLLAILIFVILSLRLSSIISKPLEEVTRSATRIALGDLKHRIFTLAQGEIGQLEQAINFMAEKQQEKIAEIDDKKSKLEAVLSHMTSGIIVVNHKGSITLINHAAQALLGVKAHKVLDKSFQAVLRHGDILTDLNQVLQQGKVVTRDIYIENPTAKSLQLVMAPIYHDKVIWEGVLVLTDVTAIKELEKMRSQFVANVSHELRTPLTSIKGFVETLQSGMVTDQNTRERFLTIIASETERLSRLIEDILDLSKIEANKNKPQLDTILLDTIIDDTIHQLKDQADKAGLVISTSSSFDNIKVLATYDGLKQVLLNLLQNAINYTSPNGTIEVSVKEEPSHYIVAVKDTGVGIPAEDLPRVFERFYRADKARSREKGGTGLGLSIVKHLIESFGGSIWAESLEGKGSTFYFALRKPEDNC
ncbi:MAG: ATP-binding protein, partial [Bacillota bacterium]|nr:ATP-binding protein [Bacillota bacterium]